MKQNVHIFPEDRDQKLKKLKQLYSCKDVESVHSESNAALFAEAFCTCLFCCFYLVFMFVLVKLMYLCMTWDSMIDARDNSEHDKNVPKTAERTAKNGVLPYKPCSYWGFPMTVETLMPSPSDRSLRSSCSAARCNLASATRI